MLTATATHRFPGQPEPFVQTWTYSPGSGAETYDGMLRRLREAAVAERHGPGWIEHDTRHGAMGDGGWTIWTSTTRMEWT